MTKPHHSAFVTAVLLVSVVAGVLALGGPAVALEADHSSPYPDTVGSTADTPVAIVAEEGDAIVKDGLAGLRFDYSVSGDFDGSVGNVTADDVSVVVSRKVDGGRKVATRLEAVSVSKEANDQRLVVKFDRTISVEAGDRIVTHLQNFSTPTQEGRGYTVQVTATSDSGATDGPVSVNYATDRAELTFENQTASQFGPQRVTVSGVVPSYGYVGVFRADNGTQGDLLGSTNVTPSFDSQNYTIALNGAVTESQNLVAVPYYETTGSSLGARKSETFDPSEDEPFRNNGVVSNATGFVSVVDAEGRVSAGQSYASGTRLFFDQGEAGTAYAINTVADGTAGKSVKKFQTDSNGTTILDTAGLGPGQYTITRLNDGSVLSLDGDDTTSAADDSFVLTANTSGTNATEAGTTAATNGSQNASETSPQATSAATTGTTSATTETDTATPEATTTSGNAGDNGGGDNGGGSNLPGPGFGIGVAVVAVLGAALLAARRRS